ncbi:hypothetical protein CSOJ01_15091 [Colletotrichum sojae]|uniref:Uncharacterized protein n=1 Tax=Colletotrichum sojae TaxID=2175907 RepID=A0A8H6INV4_9PEZI|nr:hypothetical protein CSOJ01_15091 [Colletotrichum sojae]
MILPGAKGLAIRASINHEPQPLAGKVVSVIVALISACTIASLFVVVFIYFFSFLFVFGTSILQFGFGTDLNYETCSAATLFCLGAYVSTKFIYLFMVDRAVGVYLPWLCCAVDLPMSQHIIRQTSKSRLKSKLYIFNSFGMLGVFLIIVILNFIFRITEYNKGICVIGLGQGVILALISFDAAVNVYLTILFLLPLLSLHSVKYNFWKPWTLDWRNRRIPRAPPNIRLRKLVIRTFIGSCCTLLSSVTNLAVLGALNGEVAWLCLLCCNTDIFFSALVMNWITSPGQESTLRTLTRPSRGVSTLRPEEDPSVPLDPDGSSMRKTWEQKRAQTPTTIGLHSVETPDEHDHGEEDEDLELDERELTSHGERESLHLHDGDLPDQEDKEEPDSRSSRHAQEKNETSSSRAS